MNKLVIFGPWVGEFSYEAKWWVPDCREARNTKFKDYTAIAVGFNGRKALYKDFIDEYVPFPDDLESTLKYPSSFGQKISGGDRTPDNIISFTNMIRDHYSDEFDDVIIYSPNIDTWHDTKTFSDNPPGEYINYDVDEKINKDVNNHISNYFKDDRDVVTIMPKLRYRGGIPDGENWNPENWINLTEKLITDLDLNIVILQFSVDASNGGSVSFDNSSLYKKYKDRILIIDTAGEDSVEKQLCILKNTKCSIYGSTGAFILSFLVNTPIFCQQCLESDGRLTFEWMRRLTNNHKNVKFFMKYRMFEIFNSPVQEFFDEFDKFYKKLK